MKTIKYAIAYLLEFVAAALGMILISICDVEPNGWGQVFAMLILLLGCVLGAIWIKTPEWVYSRGAAIVAVILAFTGSHTFPISKTELRLVRRKNRLGSYSELYRDSIERCYR